MRAGLFGGGTVLGASQVYATRKLLEEGSFDYLVGSSIGSITAAAIALDKVDVLESVWRSVRGTGSFQRLTLWPWGAYPTQGLFGPWGGAYDFSPLYHLLVKNLTGEAKTEAYAATVNLATKEYVLLPLHGVSPEERALHIVASCAQVPLHSAPVIRGSPYGDGGIRHVIPRYPKDKTFDKIDVVACSPISNSRIDNVRGALGLNAMRSLEIALDQHEAADYGWLLNQARRGAFVRLIEPHERPSNPFDASPETIRHLLETVGKNAWENRKLISAVVPERILFHLLDE